VDPDSHQKKKGQPRGDGQLARTKARGICQKDGICGPGMAGGEPEKEEKENEGETKKKSNRNGLQKGADGWGGG